MMSFTTYLTESNNMNILNPCRCGELNIFLLPVIYHVGIIHANDKIHYVVECPNCKAKTEECPHGGDAIMKWNDGEYE